jgi:hypothetical protein
MCRTPPRCWISGSNLSSFAAPLDRSPDDVYAPYVCNPSEALPLWCGFVELDDYMTSRLALSVFIDNVSAVT